MKQGEENPNNPKVYKEVELDTMIELISAGLWSTVNLAKALHVAESTIVEWKKREEVQDAHRKAILKFLKKRTDAEKILSEMGVESAPETPKTLVQINYTPILGGITSKSPESIEAEVKDAAK